MPLRHAEEREGSIVLDVYQTGGNDFLDPSFNGFLLAIGGHSATKISKIQCLDFSSQEFYSIGGGCFPFFLAIPLSG